ncbi:ComEC/Rec2 family competence protein [Streptomyces sp. DT24]|uniref:ComEC/Rec2 family competence protein n=1 Tax=Streptomyces sp. DT24 TaxID=3416520 RepID=UPI003CF5118E
MSGQDAPDGAGRRPGPADPAREGPLDLRLVPPALAAWAAAALSVDAPGSWAAMGAVICVAVAMLLLSVSVWGTSMDKTARTTRPGRPPHLLAPVGPGTDGHVRPDGPIRPVRSTRRRGRDDFAPSTAEDDDTARTVRWRSRRTAVAAALLCASAGATVGGLHGADVRQGPVPGLARSHARAEADVTVTSDPRQTRPAVRGDRSTPVALLMNAEVTRLTVPGGSTTRLRTPVLVIVQPGASMARWQRLLPSTRLRITARLEPPAHGGQHIAAVLRPDGKGPPHITGPPTLLQRMAGALRAGLRKATEGLAPDARALLPGLVVGDTSRIGPELQDAFMATDLTHLLAVSGANLGILLVLLIGPPGTAVRAERRGLAPRFGLSLRMTALLGCGLTLAFVLVCRPEPSVLRAAACGLVTLFAVGTGRRRSLIPALAAAVLLLVLYDPWLARSYGFLLSVLATGALLTVAPRWSASLRRRRVPPRLAEALAAAAAAQAVCAPVVVVLASRVSLVAIPCNLLAEFAVAPATVLGFAALAVAPFAMPVAQFLAWVAGWPVGWIASVARTGAGLPGAAAGWPGGWRGALLLAAVTVLAVLCAPRLMRRPWVCSAMALLLLLAVVRPAPLTRVLTGWPPPHWAFAICDVGQGDALVLAAGGGAGIVIDTGPEPRLVDRCLHDLGITRVPLLLLTHFHADHVRGLPGVLRGRAVGLIQTTSLDEPAEQAAFVRRTAAAAHIAVVRAAHGERRRLGSLDWQVLWPGDGTAAVPGPVPHEPNDASVTLFVRTGRLTLLLLGDLEPMSQQGLIRAHPVLPRVDVLKVAHHGSAHQDPMLLSSVRPRIALVSVGRDNPYGHPAARTVQALRESGAAVLRTDTDGAIAVTGDGPGLRATGRR